MAALALTFNQSDSGKVFTITDASTDVVITDSAVLAVTWNDVAYPITLPATWAVGESIDITPTDVGQASDDNSFLDGVYSVSYAFAGQTTVIYNTLLDYNVKYYVYNMLRQVPDVFNANPCKSVDVQRALFMFTFLKSLEFSAACGQVNNINTILASLQRLCLTPTINECYCN